MKTKRSVIPMFLGLVLISCEDSLQSPQLEKTLVLKTLDSLEVSFLQAQCSYNGFPVYPPVPQFAGVSGKLQFHNVSQASVADSIFLDHGQLFLSNSQESLFIFTFSDIYWYGDTTQSARLEPGEIDSVWFAYRFDPAMAPCQDSVYFDITVRNSYGDSLSMRTPTILFECSY